MTSPAPPPASGPSLWLRLLVLVAIGGGLASPLVAAAVLHWSARGGAEVVEQFLSAVRDGDADRVATLLAPGAGDEAPEARAARIVELCSPRLRGMAFALATPYRRNDALAVPLVLPVRQNQQPPPINSRTQAAAGSGAGEVVLRRVDGLWRVSGLRLPASPESPLALDLDFERPAPEWGARPSPVSPAETAFEQVGPITPEEFAAAWQTDVDADDVPAVDLLRKLIAEAGYPTDSSNPSLLTFQRGTEEAQRRHVSVHLHKVSRLQAVEEVSRQAGAHPSFGIGRLQLLPGKRPTPPAFAGPFVLEAGAVREDYRNAAGLLPLTLRAANLPAKAAALFAAVPLSASVRGVTGPAGQDLFFAQKGMPSGVPNFRGNRAPGDFYVTLTASQQAASIDVPLKDLLRDVDAIREVRLTLRAALPREIHALRIEPVAVGGTATGGGFRLTLAKVTPPAPSASGGAAGPTRYEFRAEAPGPLRLCWLAHFPGGGTASGWSSLSGPGEVSAALTGEPYRFDFKVWGAAEELSWDFTLRDIPLSRPPRRLEPPRFEGQAPVRVGEARLTDKGVALKIINDSRKELERVDVTLTYRDGEGRVLGSVGRRVAGVAAEGADLSPAVSRALFDLRPENEWAVQDAAAVPEGARSATASVGKVLFKDGTTWQP